MRELFQFTSWEQVSSTRICATEYCTSGGFNDITINISGTDADRLQWDFVGYNAAGSMIADIYWYDSGRTVTVPAGIVKWLVWLRYSNNDSISADITATVTAYTTTPLWYMGEDGFPTTDHFPELPENPVNSPFPAMMWRIDPKMNNGFPFHGLLPDVPRQSGAFENASRLSRVAIPESVKTIGDTAFSGTALTVVRVAADCTFGEGSFPENCRILRYPAHTHGQLTDSSGRVVLDRQGRRIYARRIDNG